MNRWLTRLQPWAILLLRVTLGVCMLYHGWTKVIPSGGLHAPLSSMDRHAHLVASLGLPHWLGYVSALAEFLGGIFLILGLFTRLAAAFVAINMLVAIFLVNLHRGFAITELSLTLCVMAILLVTTGPGKASITSD